jgi:hypothetical protein
MKTFISCIAVCLFISCNSASENFELCGGGLHPYYHPELNYKGSFYAIKEHFKTNYKPVSTGNNTGIVRIQFQVNCKVETGNYNMETYSFNYELTAINTQITAQLLELTKGLKDWIPAKDDEGKTVNSHKFFAFKIVNGQIVDILPK